VLTGGLPTDDLNRICLGGNSDSDSALFDDYYLSRSGINHALPQAFGYSRPTASLTIQRSGDQLQIRWPGDRLEQADSVTGPWSDIAGASSPYGVAPTAAMTFYRARGLCDARNV